MEHPVPAWLTNDFLTQSLRKEEGKETIVVTNFILSAAAPPGNNYGSYIVRVKVDYRDREDDAKTHSLSLIIKAELTDSAFAEVLSDIEYREPIFYYRFIPAASKLVKTSFAAKSFFSPSSVITILEDLKEQGYVMADRTKQLDFEHCRLYAIAAANLHAVSIRVFKDNPDILKLIEKENIYKKDLKNVEVFRNMGRNAVSCLADFVEKIPKFSKYSKVIKDCSEVIWDLLIEANKPSEVLNTVTQVDPWTTNMMFRYKENGEVSQVKLLDFQGVRYGSPVGDLIFFIWTSANHDVRRDRLQELYHIYADSFNSTLERLQCSERLSYEYLVQRVKALSPMVVNNVAQMVPFCFNSDAVDFTQLITTDNKEGELFKNPFEKFYNDNYCRHHLPQILEHMEAQGVFESLEKYKT